MADGYISQIKLPNAETYDFRDRNLKVYTGSCSTAAGTAIKDVVTDGTFTLEKGAVVFVNFSATNSAAVGNLKLKFNGEADTNAKPIKYLVNGNDPANIPGASYLRVNQTYMFQYDGTNWVAVLNYDTNSNDAAGYIREFQNGAYVKPTTVLYRYQLLLPVGDGEHVIPVNTTSNSTATNKSTITTAEFDIRGHIEYYSSTSTIQADGNIDGRYHWMMRSDVNLGYSFNTGSTLTPYENVYIVATLVSPTAATLRNPTATGNNASAQATGANAGPITQALPTEEDGYIYIKLGRAYSASNIILTLDHPIYWFKDGKIQPYAGYATATSRAAITTTANAVAYYTNTTGTFGSKASANGALYATSANGALQWGTLPIAQGGTGVTSFTKNQVILSDNTNGTTGLTSRAYSDSTSAGALSNTSTNFVTERNVYFGLPTLNNAHNYTSSSTYYAPTTGGTAGHVLIGAGATTAPAWYGGTVMSGSAAASWKTAFNGTTDATATNAAAVTIAGGLGVAKKLHVGSTLTVPNITIGSTNEYGDAYTPIYWHEGVPTTVTLVQQCAFTIKSGMSGVKLSHAAITVDSYVTEIVITSGESKLNSAISWTSAAGYIKLTCSSTVSGDVTGYIMISRGGEITATATDIT